MVVPAGAVRVDEYERVVCDTRAVAAQVDADDSLQS